MFINAEPVQDRAIHLRRIHTMRPFGELLIELGHVSQSQLDDALAAQKEGREAGRLGEILIRRNVTTEAQVLNVVSLQFGLEFRPSLSVEDVDGSLISGTRFPLAYAKANNILPLKPLPDGTVLTAITDPTRTSQLDLTRMMLGAPLTLCVVTSEVLRATMYAAYDRAATPMDFGETFKVAQHTATVEEGSGAIDAPLAADEAPVIRLVNQLLIGAIKARASDIHIEPYERMMVVRYRIDGVLKQIVEPPKPLQNALISRIKIMSGLNIAEKRLPQDGRIRLTYAGKEIDIRLSTAPTVYGERIVMRLLDKSVTILDFKDIGFDDQQMKTMQGLIERPHGIILVTGPTGSGKTTTLYAMLSRLNTPELNILTIEDPVEYQIQGISQMPVNSKIDLTFANGLRCFLRQDPDVIMVGEIRDKETAEIAIQAALTGHLVFSTVHTNDAPGSVTRLVDMGVESFLVASSLSAAVAQRLVRRVCKHCRVRTTISSEELRRAQVPEERIDRYLEGEYFRANPSGCDACEGTGYRGRTAIYEMMVVDDEARALILRNADSNTIKRTAVQSQGMVLLREDGIKCASQGITTLEEIMRVTEEQHA